MGEGSRARRREGKKEGLGEKEMGKELGLLTDGCRRGAEVFLSPVRAQAVCGCVCLGVCAGMHPFVYVCLHVCA